MMAGLAVVLVSGIAARASQENAMAPAADAAKVKRGAYLVGSMGCNDCHTPWKMGPNGPEPDTTRALTGHPESVKIAEAPAIPEGWGWVAAPDNTAFAGPWGVSFTMNLTPDKDTGLGNWTEEQFIATMRTGRHLGKGRRVLPPMPVQMLAALNDEDIKAVFAYLQSLKPVRNRIPAPLDPSAATAGR
jgi:mono/diheme cytochrome c family protein